MYCQFNGWLNGKSKLTLRSCMIVVGRCLAVHSHSALSNIDVLNMAKPSDIYSKSGEREKVGSGKVSPMPLP